MAHKRTKRTDGHGRAFKGSQLQVQLLVNTDAARLDAAIRGAIPTLADRRLEWKAPLAADGYVEPRDGSFLRHAGLERLRPSLSTFWPPGGPVWDAVATFRPDGQHSGVVLVEGKNYPEEMHSACKAGPGPFSTIEKAIDRTRQSLASSSSRDAWMRSYYQLANRLAWLEWLRNERIDAHLVLLCILDDPAHDPTTRSEWERGLRSMRTEMGLPEHVPHVAEVFLAAKHGTFADLPIPPHR